MAQYLLIEFDNDAQCAALMDKLEDKSTMRAVGLFQKPKRFCECGFLSDLEQSQQVTRGQRFGWWIHRNCRLPRPGPVSPRNLLEPEELPAKDRNIFVSLTSNFPLLVHHG